MDIKTHFQLPITLMNKSATSPIFLELCLLAPSPDAMSLKES